MRSHARQERRLLREQETVGARRAERLEQGKLGAHSNVELVVTKAKRKAREEVEQEHEAPKLPQRRTARPGKPLKR